MAGKFLRAFQPLIKFIPEIKAPERRVSLGEKFLWTGLALVIYFIMSEIPLYGLHRSESVLVYRIIFASTQGTLMELGIGPIVTAGIILQLLASSGLISVDFSDPQDRALYAGTNKVLAMIMTIVQASAYLVSGILRALGPLQAVVIFVQLLIAGLIVILLDEMLEKGWGIGSGISLFILAGVAQHIMVDCFSLMPSIGGVGRFRGVIPAIIDSLATGAPLSALIVRPEGDPSILGLLLTIAIFIFCIYMQGVRVEIPVAYSRYRGFRGKYPINLLFVSVMPVIFTAALFGNIQIFGQILWNNYRNNPILGPIVRLLGDFKETEGGVIPVGGLAYYVTSPRGFMDFISDPLRYSVYVILLVIFCVLFSWVWLQVGGMDPRTIARQLVDAGLQVPGFRKAEKPIETILERYIPTVTILGGFIVGLLAAVADIFGAFGTGTGILLSVGIIYQFYQQIMREQLEEIYPGIKKLLGV